MSYSEEYFTARESWRDWRIEAQTLIELAHIEPGARVLEIGCGGGGLMRMLRAHGANVVGIDTLNVALELARNRSLRGAHSATKQSPIELEIDSQKLLAMTFIQIGETPTLPFRDASFQAILGQHVVEHLPNTDAALREWKRLLKPNGRIALATPNALYPDPAHFADDDHAHIFTPTELRDVAKRAGFIVESCQTIFPYLSPVRALRGISIIAHRFFQRTPYFASRGRTIVISMRNSDVA